MMQLRALETARRVLHAYEPTPLGPAIDEALQAFIREREAVLPGQDRVSYYLSAIGSPSSRRHLM